MSCKSQGNQCANGFGILEAMIGIVLLGIVAASSASLFSSMISSQGQQKFMTNAGVFQEELRAILSSPTTCRQNFQNLVLLPGASRSVSQILKQNGTTAFEIGKVYSDYGFKISRIDLKNYSDLTLPNGNATVSVELENISGSAGLNSVVRNISLQTRKNGTNQLVDCIALAKMSDGIWQYITGTNWDVFFVGGRVGIGNNDPKATLDVSGEVKIGTSVLPCIPEIRGSVRFDNTLSQLQFCDGTTWRSVVTKAEGTSGMSCISVKNSKPGNGVVFAVCPDTHQVTGCSGACRGNSVDSDVSSVGNSCRNADANCAGSNPVIYVEAICCKLGPP